MADFPGAIHTEITTPPGVTLGTATPVHRLQHNALEAEVTAVETNLGTNPHQIDGTVAVSTTPTTVKQKTNVLARRIADILGATWDAAIPISLTALLAKFDATTGHTHAGTSGDAPGANAAKLQGRALAATAPSDGQVVTWDNAGSTWKPVTPSGGGGGMTNPMTTQDDIIIGGSAGAPARLAKGTDGQVLTVDPTTHHLVWATPSGGGGGSSPYTPPVSADWSWVNQGAATDDTAGSMLAILKTLAGAGGINAKVHARPSAAPWAVKMAFVLSPAPFQSSTGVGFGFRDSTGGKLVVVDWWSEIHALRVDWLNSTTSFNTDIQQITVGDFPIAPLWVALGDDGTNIYFDVYRDGLHPVRLYSVGRTAFLANAPDQVEFHIYDNTAASGKSVASLLSYEVI